MVSVFAQDSAKLNFDLTHTGTLPVIYITTEDSVEITSRTDYINATYYLDPMGCDGVEALGSPEVQLPLQIRGRGNVTWTQNKKPYKLKFERNTKFLGMHGNKHFALLTCYGPYAAFVYYTGLQFAPKLGMRWTPSMVPLELYINGGYRGIYYATGTVRVDENRLNIVEQPDYNEDPATISGGWLVESDNYADPHQILLDQPGIRLNRITYHSPENLSSLQLQWLTDQFAAITEAVCDSDKYDNRWANYLDIDDLARTIIVQETLNNRDAYNGSWHFYHDAGPDSTWHSGPLWDMEYARDEKTDFLWNELDKKYLPFITELVKFPTLMKRVQTIWQSIPPVVFSGLWAHLRTFGAQIDKSYTQDYLYMQSQLWQPSPGTGLEMEAKMEAHFRHNVDWLNERWSGDNPDYSIYTLVFAEAGGGEVLVNGKERSQIDVFAHDSLTVTFHPFEDMQLSSVLVNGREMCVDGPLSELRLDDVSSDMTVITRFSVQNSRLDEVLFTDADNVKVYDLKGSLIYSGPTDGVAYPARGVYILIDSKGSRKIKI